MNTEMKRTRHLESANLKVTIFALISLALSAWGGFTLYKLIMDAMDNTLEYILPMARPITLGGLTINEAQISMVLGALAFLIPFWLLISLLVKRHALSNLDTVGTGLFWAMFIGFTGSLLYSFGILQKLVKFDFANITKINTDILSIIGAIISFAGMILTLWTIINIAVAENSPIDYDDDEDDEIEEVVVEEEVTALPVAEKKIIRKKTLVPDEKVTETVRTEKKITPEDYGYDETEKPVRKMKRTIRTEETPAEVPYTPTVINPIMDVSDKEDEVKIITDPGYERTDAVEPVSAPASENTVNTDISEPEVISPLLSPSDNKAMAEDAVQDIAPEESPVPDSYENVSSEVYSTPLDYTADESVNLVDEPTNTTVPVEDESSLNIETPSGIREEELKVTRRYIDLPGEEKVLVVTREFDAEGKLLDERSEIKNKADLRS